MWNYYARFLYYPEFFQRLFEKTTLGHGNHPLLVPGVVAFIWRLTGSYPSGIVPQLVGWLPTVMMPLMIYTYYYKRSAWMAFGIGLLLAGNIYYLNMGLNQYADIWVSFFFFISILSILQWRKKREVIWLWIWGSALGAASFSKNEGLFLSALSAIFLLPYWAARDRWYWALIGFMPFAIAVFVHKMLLPVHSPVVATWHAGIWQLLLDTSRYRLVFKYLEDALSGIYSVMFWALMAVLINSLRKREKPDVLWWLLIAAITGYVSVFLTLTVNGLEWNVANTLPRLLLHLLPAAYLVCADLMWEEQETPQYPA